MKQNKFQFKTTIKCGGCVSTIKPYLDNEKRISEWKVDLSSQPSLLTINSNELTEEELIEIIEESGFKILP